MPPATEILLIITINEPESRHLDHHGDLDTPHLTGYSVSSYLIKVSSNQPFYKIYRLIKYHRNGLNSNHQISSKVYGMLCFVLMSAHQKQNDSLTHLLSRR